MPQKIESLFMDIDGIEEFVIVDINDESKHDFKIVAFVKLADNPDITSSKEEIKNKIRLKERDLKLNIYIKEIYFFDNIPKTALKKPKRFALKEMLDAQIQPNDNTQKINLHKRF